MFLVYAKIAIMDLYVILIKYKYFLWDDTMEIGQLEAFDRAARDGNFTRAAESLGLTQPAVSTRITTLEAELGGALFERRGRELRLTSLGVQFLPYAQRMLAVMADSLQVIRQISTVVASVKSKSPHRLPLS